MVHWDGKGCSEAWSRTHEGSKGGITFKSKKQAGGEGRETLLMLMLPVGQSRVVSKADEGGISKPAPL